MVPLPFWLNLSVLSFPQEALGLMSNQQASTFRSCHRDKGLLVLSAVELYLECQLIWGQDLHEESIVPVDCHGVAAVFL